MSQKQLNKFYIISKVIAKELTNLEASELLGISERQVIRIKKGVIEEGPSFLTHKNTGRQPIHSISDDLKSKIISLKNSDLYKEANFLHFQEILEEHESIKISYTPLYKLLTSNGITSPKKRRKTKNHHRRKRKAQEGMLIQIDATPHEWFGTDQKFALHGGIDDATGKVVGLYLSKNECLQGYFEIMRQLLCNHGIPGSIYADRHTIFLSQKAGKLSIEDQLAGKVVNDTQFGRALNDFGITLIAARSAQAKGRVERLWETLQSRLPIEFKIAGITTIDQANKFLAEYIPKFNAKFAVEASNPESAYRSLPDKPLIDHVLCVKQVRTIDNGSVFSFYNRHFKVIMDNDVPAIYPKSKLYVLVSPKFGIRVEYKENIYEVLPYIKPKKLKDVDSKKSVSTNTYIPPDDHYFKQGHLSWKKVTLEDSREDMLRMLEDIFLSKYA